MKLTKTVGQYLLGSGSIQDLGSLLDRPDREKGVVFLIDHFFSEGALVDELPKQNSDRVLYIDTRDEPKTVGIDKIVNQIKNEFISTPAAIVGIGGGSTLDTAKAVSNLLTNGGKAEDYQGWDLVKVPGVFKVGIPTLSGTGAEGSRTCVMMNPEKNLKLGMNSDFTVFDRLVLDPDLTATVPRDQFFYTGLDTYIHCIESLNGSYRHSLADAYSDQSLRLCRDVFLNGDMMAPHHRETLMVASFLGGSAIGNSFVGIVHPFSAGLSMALSFHHCIANCIVMNVMEDFYPKETEEFKKMLEIQKISLPSKVCANLSDKQRQTLFDATIIHEKPLANALGDNFRDILTFDRVLEIFDRM